MNAEFEKIAREKLSGYELSVDTDALWANVNAQVHPEKTKRRGAWWLFFLGLLVGVGLFSLFFINNNNNTENTATIAASVVAEEANSSSNKQKTNIANATQMPVTETEQLNSAVSNATTNETINNTQFSTIKEATTIKSKSVAVTTTSNTHSQQTQSAQQGNNSITPPTFENTIDQDQNSTDQSSIINVTAHKPVANSIVKQTLRAVDQLPTLSPGLLYSEASLAPDFLTDYKVLPLKSEQKIIKRGRRPGAFFRNLRFGLGLYGGISQSNTDLEAKNESAREFLLARTNSEKQLETLHLGFNAIVQSEQNFFLRTGVEYTRIGSLFSRASQTTELDSVPGIIEIRINSVTGLADTIRGNVLVTKTVDYTKKSYNYFHLVDVPVIIGYNFGNDPWRIGVEAGIYANIMVSNKGDIPLNDGTDFYDIGEDENDWFRTNIGISPYAGINAAYNVSENIQIHVTPSFRFNSLFSTDANPLKEQHGNLGVRAGVRYMFD